MSNYFGNPVTGPGEWGHLEPSETDAAVLDYIAQILRGECGSDEIGEITRAVAAAGRIVEFEAAGETEPCLMCGEPSVPEGQGPLCERCEAGQDAEANNSR